MDTLRLHEGWMKLHPQFQVISMFCLQIGVLIRIFLLAGNLSMLILSPLPPGVIFRGFLLAGLLRMLILSPFLMSGHILTGLAPFLFDYLIIYFLNIT